MKEINDDEMDRMENNRIEKYFRFLQQFMEGEDFSFLLPQIGKNFQQN